MSGPTVCVASHTSRRLMLCWPPPPRMLALWHLELERSPQARQAEVELGAKLAGPLMELQVPSLELVVPSPEVEVELLHSRSAGSPQPRMLELPHLE